MLRCQQLLVTSRRSQLLSRGLSSKTSTSTHELRRQFLDFYRDRGHLVVPSASVLPRNDKSLYFVNAGMNQFKSAILGASKPPSSRVTNVQKCIRLGGKHNDLDAVGKDGHHHTFFEMMGNWSFGDYFKEGAVRMAWDLVTKVYGLPQDRLFVTYFGGCSENNLQADEEAKEAWRSVGVREDRILPFGMEHNFWEMGAVGPCGPCTEIHYDHLGNQSADRVNMGFDDLVELGNVVFMQHKRTSPNGEFKSLSKCVVDTGFGLERLAAIKAGSASNYDSDLFSPLFATITQATGAPEYGGRFDSQLDANYRILADHARMICVCLADGAFPDSSRHLRMVIKRTLAICKESFGCDHNLLVELVYRAGEILGSHYPEVGDSGERAKVLLKFQEDLEQQAVAAGRKILPKLIREYPGTKVEESDAARVYDALALLKRLFDGKMSGEAALSLHNSGISKRLIKAICENILKVEYPEDELETLLEEAKHETKLNTAKKLGHEIRQLPRTNTAFVHKYSSPNPLNYAFPAIDAKVNAIVSGDRMVDKLEPGQEGQVYLDRTCFYSEAGGQVGDVGRLDVIGSGDVKASFEVTDCQRVLEDRVAHVGKMENSTLNVGDQVMVRINTTHRLKCMQNHTGAHLLNEALNLMLPLTCQNSSHVSQDHFRMDMSTFGHNVDSDFVVGVEEHIHKQIVGEEGFNDGITRQEMSFSEASANTSEGKLITLPGEHYPEKVSVISLPLGGREPCCGTHLHRISDLQSFAVVDVQYMGNGIKSFKCFTGQKAVTAREKGIKMIEHAFDIEEIVSALNEDSAQGAISDGRKMVQSRLDKLKSLQGSIPQTVLWDLKPILEGWKLRLQTLERASSKVMMQDEMRILVENNKDSDFITHAFDASSQAKVQLSKVTDLCKDKPVLVLAYNEKGLFGRACVPKNICSELDALTWLDQVAIPISGKASPPRGKDGNLVANFSIRSSENESIKDKENVIEFLKDYLKYADEYASSRLNINSCSQKSET